MPPVRLYEIRSIREDKEDYNTIYEFRNAEAVAKWLNDKLKVNHIKRYHVVNYMNHACCNKHYNALTLALDHYKIGHKRVKTFPKDFVNGRIQQSQIITT